MATNTEPQWYQKMLKHMENNEYKWEQEEPGGPYRFCEQPSAITLRSGSEDMIKCSPEGFWVRGVKVKQDDKEAEAVYNAFKQWLTWATLNDMR